jgi:DNA-directed RNA polymerase specialized sigma24 family protein
MGPRFPERQKESEALSPANSNSVHERYDAYFPRLYAYVHSCVGGDMPTQDIVVQAFSDAFQRAGDADEERFRTTLFRRARHLCRPHLRHDQPDDADSLSRWEREVISLVFDAGLTREQVSRTFRIRENKVGCLLVAGLRKLKKQTSPSVATAYLKLA